MSRSYDGNILLVSNYPSDVGYAWWLMELFWVSLSKQFEQISKTAFLAYPSIKVVPDAIKNSNIEVVELTVPGTTKAEREKLKHFIKSNRIAHVYFTDRPWFNISYLILRSYGIHNIVVHDHTPGDRPPIRGIKGLVKAARNRLPLACADTQFCVSELMRQRSIQNARIPHRRCITVQNGTPPVQGTQDQRDAVRKVLGISDDAVVCVTTGRAHRYKRFDFIIEVASEISKQNQEHKLVFLLIGDGPMLPELQSNIERLDLTTSVKLLGFRSDARELLAAADIAIHAALGEGFSLSIVEYMSAGLPVLVPNIPSVKQAIDHEINGFVYGKNDVGNAAYYMEKLAADIHLRSTMGINAKNKATRDFSLVSCTENFERACHKAFISQSVSFQQY
jgi:glycosyltransferase involved in cell wall biosynthesis